ncbi:hypothetical protein KR018_003108 [Drosophila ironensis]|nr:hypothetical protein KR018_003108 [Drosophila ironensis]
MLPYVYHLQPYSPAPETRPVPDDSASGAQSQQQPKPSLCKESISVGTQTERSVLSKNLPPTPPAPTPTLPYPQAQTPSPPPMSDRNADPSRGPGVEIPYNVDWIFPRLRRPSLLWYFTSQIVITAVGLFSKFMLTFWNTTHVHNRERLVNLVGKRPKGVPLVTVSNHQSCFDDPGLWGTLPVTQVCNTFSIRWSMAAHDICFTNKWHSLFFMLGKCIPVVRGNGVYQEAINLCIQKAAEGHWIHVFPEGRVNMDKEEIRLKWGVGRIIYESPTIPIVLPLWHEGMDELLPNVEPYMFNRKKQVTFNVGQPLDLSQFVLEMKRRQVPEPEARKLITDKIQAAFRVSFPVPALF